MNLTAPTIDTGGTIHPWSHCEPTKFKLRFGWCMNSPDHT